MEDLLSDARRASLAGEHDGNLGPAASGLAPLPGPSGSVTVRAGDGRADVILRGEVDLDLGDELLVAAADALEHAEPVTVDAADVTYMDSTGVAFLARVASRAPRPVRLVDPSDLVRFLVALTTVSSMVEIVESGGGVQDCGRQGEPVEGAGRTTCHPAPHRPPSAQAGAR